MKTTNGHFLSPESIITVHFNDDIRPTQIQYSFENQGKRVFLAEYGCDANDMADIKELAIEGYTWLSNEHFHGHIYEVKNGSLGTPFTDDMIPNVALLPID